MFVPQHSTNQACFNPGIIPGAERWESQLPPMPPPAEPPELDNTDINHANSANSAPISDPSSHSESVPNVSMPAKPVEPPVEPPVTDEPLPSGVKELKSSHLVCVGKLWKRVGASILILNGYFGTNILNWLPSPSKLKPLRKQTNFVFRCSHAFAELGTK